jgi:hypothetical protein
MADHLFSKLLIKSLPVISTLSLLQYSFGQNAVLPGELNIEPPTLICLGFEWKIEGDINRNAQVEMAYTAYSIADKRAAAPIIWHAPQSDVMADFELKNPALEYKSLKSFSNETGQELHAIEVDYDDFINVQEPSFKAYQERNPGFFPIYDFEEMDFRLSESSKAIDAGVLIPNVNDAYTGNAPDLGAYEYGQDPPHYGPRNTNKY